MFDICKLLQEFLEEEWTEDTPAFTDILCSFDEINPNWKGKIGEDHPLFQVQILFENGPAKSVFVTNTINRIEHQCKITIYVRPVRYMPDDIEAAKTIFLSVKSEINRILKDGRYSVEDVTKINLGTWTDEPIEVGRDTKLTKGKEPIVFVASQTVECIYYG